MKEPNAFSEYVWLVEMDSKKSISVIRGCQKIFNTTSRRPVRVQTDRGREFINKDLIN